MDSIDDLICRWRNRLTPAIVVTLLTMIVGMLGCNKPPFDVAPASGHVTLDGQPLSGAKVMFAPIANGDSIKAGKPAFGLLQSDGGFTLTTYTPEDGAVIGEHWVTVIRMPAKREHRPGASGDKPASDGATEPWNRVMFPERLTVNANGKNDFTITLTSEIVAKHGQVDH